MGINLSSDGKQYVVPCRVGITGFCNLVERLRLNYDTIEFRFDSKPPLIISTLFISILITVVRSCSKASLN